MKYIEKVNRRRIKKLETEKKIQNGKTKKRKKGKENNSK
ncbi:hypothetical protein ES703_31229 [subsurface metagenome]